jgi:adenine-specific DNA methylase
VSLAITKSERARRALDEEFVGRFAGLDPTKLRGGYYTPIEITAWLCQWAIRSSDDSVLEPSCGDGAFIESAARRLIHLGARPSDVRRQLTGIEILTSEAEKTEKRVAQAIGRNSTSNLIVRGDFFDWCLNKPSELKFDAVVGNPPFIRYQSFPSDSRERAMRLMALHGLTPNRLTNIWVPFVVGAIDCLAAGGRLAFVLPAELLQVSYASQLRTFLADRFRRIDIVACNELFFEGAEQEVLLFLADSAVKKPTAKNDCRVSLTQTASTDSIVGVKPQTLIAKTKPKVLRHDSEKWLKYFLDDREIDLMRRLRESRVATPLLTHATVDVGVVTGKNDFFLLSEEHLTRHRLSDFAIPLVGRAAHLSGATLSKADWRALASKGERVYLFHLNGHGQKGLPSGLKEYVRLGEEQNFHKGYKCSIRTPWYSVPSVWTPDCFFFRQIYDFPRVVLNRAGATATDTIHRMTCKDDPQKVASNVYTYLSAASAEIEGRSYGGGVLELEPTEAERMLMPATLAKAMSMKECDRLVRSGRLDAVLEYNARAVLHDGIGLGRSDCTMLRNIWEKMRDRRGKRRRSRSRTLEQ